MIAEEQEYSCTLLIIQVTPLLNIWQRSKAIKILSTIPLLI